MPVPASDSALPQTASTSQLVLPVTPFPAPPGPVDNPIQAWLDTAGLPWRATRGELASHFGVNADNPYQWEIVPLAVDPPPLDGMLWPFGFQAFPNYHPAMPPGRLSTHVWVGDDTETNIALAAGQLGHHLGSKPITDRYNTRHVEWRWGSTSITLTVWPPAMQTGTKLSNPAHQRDPRLRTACSISIETGWRPPLNPQERAWLGTFEPLGPVRNWTPAQAPRAFGTGMFPATLMEFLRAPPADLNRFRGHFGLSADRQALIACDDDALYVLPLAVVTGFDVTRTLPGKGGGGSRLAAVCRTGYEACPTKTVTVAQGAKADDLNDLAARLAGAAGRPFTLEEYDYDT